MPAWIVTLIMLSVVANGTGNGGGLSRIHWEILW